MTEVLLLLTLSQVCIHIRDAQAARTRPLAATYRSGYDETTIDLKNKQQQALTWLDGLRIELCDALHGLGQQGGQVEPHLLLHQRQPLVDLGVIQDGHWGLEHHLRVCVCVGGGGGGQICTLHTSFPPLPRIPYETLWAPTTSQAYTMGCAN